MTENTPEMPEGWEPKYLAFQYAPEPTPEQAQYQSDLYRHAMGYGDYRD